MRLYALILAALIASCSPPPVPTYDPIQETVAAYTPGVTQSVSPPFFRWPGDAVSAYVGSYTDGQQYVAYQNQRTHACERILISNTSADIDHDVVVYLTAFNDYGRTVGPETVYVDCTAASGGGFPLGAVNTTHTITVYGGDGNDRIDCSRSCVAYGEGGADTLNALHQPSVLYGGDGNDCLYSEVSSLRDCGAGTDKIGGVGFTSYCENAVPYCQ
jgi:hypothetical protein